MSFVDEVTNKLSAVQCGLRIMAKKIENYQNDWITCCGMWKFRSYMVSQVPMICPKEQQVVKPIFETSLDPFKSVNFFGKTINCTGYEDHSIECAKLWSSLIAIVVAATIILTVLILYCTITTFCCLAMLCCKKCRKSTVINVTTSPPPLIRRISSKITSKKSKSMNTLKTTNSTIPTITTITLPTESKILQSLKINKKTTRQLMDVFQQFTKNLQKRKPQLSKVLSLTTKQQQQQQLKNNSILNKTF